MDRLQTMRTLITVARLSSFSGAAEELGISRALVSRHVADLERHLGTRLLHRTTRAVTPTTSGYDYIALCNRVLAALMEGEEEIAASRNEVVGEIAIQCPIWLGSFGVSEAAARFCVENPKVKVRISFEEPSPNPHEFLDREFDVCIQPTSLRDSSITVKRIGEIAFCLVASRDYLGRRGVPRVIEELVDHDLLLKTGENQWDFGDAGSLPVGARARMSTNSVFALCSASAAGLGIALVPRMVAERFVREDAISVVLEDVMPTPRPLFVAFAPGSEMPRRVREFVDFLSVWFDARHP